MQINSLILKVGSNESMLESMSIHKLRLNNPWARNHWISLGVYEHRHTDPSMDHNWVWPKEVTNSNLVEPSTLTLFSKGDGMLIGYVLFYTQSFLLFSAPTGLSFDGFTPFLGKRWSINWFGSIFFKGTWLTCLHFWVCTWKEHNKDVGPGIVSVAESENYSLWELTWDIQTVAGHEASMH